MRHRLFRAILAGALLLSLSCGAGPAASNDGGAGADGGARTDGGASVDGGAPACATTASTAPTATTSPKGCAVLARDTSACEASRRAAGLSGHWLAFSCRVTLTKPGAAEIVASADGLPDYQSNYFRTSDACYASYEGAQNPNFIAAKSYELRFSTAPDTNAQAMRGAIVGLALNGVPIFANFAAPGDDIYTEALTFDRCGGHPQMTGTYHYHGEPYAISYDDSAFIGVMRDGYPIYGRRDADGSLPAALDEHGGHTAATRHSEGAAVYHYHLNEQTSTSAGTRGERQWFLTKGTYRGTPGACTGCT